MMNDPHVEQLTYSLETGDELAFEDPWPVETETAQFHMRLVDDIVMFKMNQHHSSEESARKVVDEFLENWAIDVNLEYGSRQLWFIFDPSKTRIIDRNPIPPGSPVTVELEAATLGVSGMSANLVVSRRRYPEPPSDFVVSSHVATMWQRYERYLQDREPLQHMANFCLTVIVDSAKQFPGKNKRNKAALMYRVCPKVLSKLGYLTGNVGDSVTARKATVAEQRSLTPQEVKWLEELVKKLIRRAGEYAADPQRQRQQITMADLPQL